MTCVVSFSVVLKYLVSFSSQNRHTLRHVARNYEGGSPPPPLSFPPFALSPPYPPPPLEVGTP